MVSGKHLACIYTPPPTACGLNTLIGCNSELLIGIPRTAGIDLHLDAVGYRPTGDLKAFVAINNEVPIR